MSELVDGGMCVLMVEGIGVSKALRMAEIMAEGLAELMAGIWVN